MKGGVSCTVQKQNRLVEFKKTEISENENPKSRLKIMMTAIFAAKVTILQEFLPGKEIGNGKFYQEIVRSSSSP
jgi:hypothetical protein